MDTSKPSEWVKYSITLPGQISLRTELRWNPAAVIFTGRWDVVGSDPQGNPPAVLTVDERVSFVRRLARYDEAGRLSAVEYASMFAAPGLPAGTMLCFFRPRQTAR